jgi:hypothetical protein
MRCCRRQPVSNSFLFVEFEDAGPASVFVRAGPKPLRDWARRFEHGYSQIIDWFQKLREMLENPEMEARFGSRTIDYEAALIVGRRNDLGLVEQRRLEWRSSFVLVDSKQVTCLTFDNLLDRMEDRLNDLESAAKTAGHESKH